MRRSRVVAVAALSALVPLLVGCEPDRLELTATPRNPAVGESVLIQARQVGGPDGHIVLREGNAVLKRCDRARVCEVAVSSITPAERRVEAELIRADDGAVALRNGITVQWTDLRVSVTSSGRSVPAGTVVVVTATASTATVDRSVVIELTENLQVVRTCTGEPVCRFRARAAEPLANGHFEQRLYEATISRPGGIRHEATGITVTWNLPTTTTTTATTSTTAAPPGGDTGHHPPPPPS